MTIYEEIQKKAEELGAGHYGEEETIAVSSHADWITYLLPSLTKAGLLAGRHNFRKEMIHLAAMAILAIQTVDKRDS